MNFTCNFSSKLKFHFSIFNFFLFVCVIVALYMVAWKRGLAILSAGAVKVTPDPRVRLYNGFSLQIRDAVPQDAGDYVCTIQTLDPIEITHTVEILGKFNGHFYVFTNFD